MITKDEITMYMRSYALFYYATKYPYERKYSSSNEQFWDTFPWQDFFPDISLTIPWLLTTSQTFPWHVSNSLTFPGFPDKWSPCVNLKCQNVFTQQSTVFMSVIHVFMTVTDTGCYRLFPSQNEIEDTQRDFKSLLKTTFYFWLCLRITTAIRKKLWIWIHKWTLADRVIIEAMRNLRSYVIGSANAIICKCYVFISSWPTAWVLRRQAMVPVAGAVPHISGLQSRTWVHPSVTLRHSMAPVLSANQTRSPHHLQLHHHSDQQPPHLHQQMLHIISQSHRCLKID